MRHPAYPNALHLLVSLGILLVTRSVSAEVPHLIRYQGQAVNSQGVPLEGPYTLTFRLYDAPTAGTKLWEERQDNVPLAGGHFAVLLGSQTTLTGVDWSQPCWLSVQVNGESELTPRQQITSVPLALRAKTAEQLTTPVATSNIEDDANALVPAGAIILWSGSSCPAGYTRVSALDDRFLRAGATYNAAAGGRDTHDHGGSTNPHTLTIAQTPAHSHGGIQIDVNNQVGDQYGHGYWYANAVQSSRTSNEGGGQPHSHGLEPANHVPPFATILLCQKD